jgi:isopenicillin-N epimerase
MTTPSPEAIRAEFLLDPDVVFLNHGSFGACPRPVFEAYQAWQREMERQPVEFLGRRFGDLMLTARTRLAAYLGADARDLVYIPNATTGVNIVARSLARELAPGDEIVTTDHEYGACDRAWRAVCAQTGAVYRRVPIPLPVTTHDDVIERVWAAVGPRTRVLYISHITSPTALTFPVEALCARAREVGILTLIDGAHAPGQIPLDLAALGADFYTGNCHKWLCAPKGAAFLYARPAVRDKIVPLVVSWGVESMLTTGDGFVDELEYAGTHDYSPALSVPDAIDYQAARDWPAVRDRCHALAREARARLIEIPGVRPIHPDDPAWYAQMVAVELPEGTDAWAMKDRLYDKYRIEIPMIVWDGRPLIRASVQGYNGQADIDALLGAVGEVVG